MTTPDRTQQKGINFKQTPHGKLMLVHRKSFEAFLASLSTPEEEWIALRFEDYKKLSKRGLFASVHPIKKAG